MRGLMMDRPLLISSLLEHAATVFGSVEIVTRTVEGPVHRYTWAGARQRSKQLAQALQALHLRDGDTVATLAWNTHRHLELRVVDEAGRALPPDGRSVGELQIRGPYVCSAYLGDQPGAALTADGWFPTGDVAVLHRDGSMQITDRKKDLIKSGGEWISSLDLENAAARHPEIAIAAVIGVPHEKWGERPLLIAQPAPGASPTKESVLEFLEGQVAKLWLPDDVVFVDALPIGPTGKVQKMALRERYGG